MIVFLKQLPTLLQISFLFFSDTSDSEFSLENSKCEYKNDNVNDNYSDENYDNDNDNDNSRLIYGVVSLSPDIHLINQDENNIEKTDLETEDLLSHINQEESIGDLNPINGDIDIANLNNRDNIDINQPLEVDQQQQQPATANAPAPIPADEINDEQIRILTRHNLLNVMVGQPPEIREVVVNYLRELGSIIIHPYFLSLIMDPKL